MRYVNQQVYNRSEGLNLLNIIIMKEIKTEKIWNINELLEKISQYEEIRPID